MDTSNYESVDREAEHTAIKKTERLSQQVSKLVLAEIQSGKLAQGAKLLSEVSLAKQYGVSRTVMREALASLKNDGILESTQGKSILLKSPQNRQAFRLSDVFGKITQEEVTHLYEMRAILEAEAAGLAALRCTQEDVLSIQKAFNALKKAAKENAPGEEAHFAYNQAIAKASHNPVLIEFLSFLQYKLSDLAKELRLQTMTDPSRTAIVLAEHSLIFENVTSKNPAKARESVLGHLSNAAKRAGLEIYIP